MGRGGAMAYLDEDRRRRARLRNIAQSIALIGGIGIITALSAYVLFGPSGVVWALAFVGVFSFIGPRIAPDAIMMMFRARPIDRFRGGGLVKLVETLSKRAGLASAPRFYIIPSATLNAFAVGTPSRYAIAVTEGLLGRLDAREIAGVLAHEITHVRNNDIWVMSLADVLSRFTRTLSFIGIFLLVMSLPAALVMGKPMPWAAIALLYFAPTLSSLLQLALSRSREYDADLGAAALTGDPEGLASALSKLERYQGRFWEDMFMPGRRIPLPSVLRTHPQTSERIARLLALKKPDRAPFPFAGPWSPASGFKSDPPRPRYHWTGLWY
jgi:heat shock protein HtpX